MDVSEIIRFLGFLGYSGNCINEKYLVTALCFGEWSIEYKEMITWLEGKFEQNCSEMEHQTMNTIFEKLRNSSLNPNPRSPLFWRYEALNAVLDLLYWKIKSKNLNSFTVQPTFQKIIHKMWRGYSNREGKQEFVICDQLSPTGEISKKHWKYLQATITSEILRLTSSNNTEIFYEVRTDADCKLRVIACYNFVAFTVFRTVILQLPPAWHGAMIAIMSMEECANAFNHSAWVWIPFPFSFDVPMLLKTLAYQNPTINMKGWTFCKYGMEECNGHHILLYLNEHSITMLKKSDGYLNLNGERVLLRMNRKLGKWYNLQSLSIGEHFM